MLESSAVVAPPVRTMTLSATCPHFVRVLLAVLAPLGVLFMVGLVTTTVMLPVSLLMGWL